MLHATLVRTVTVILRSILITVCLVVGAIAAEPVPADPVRFNIDKQPLRDALAEFARQSDREILFSTDVVEDKDAPLVVGEYEPEDALELLLADTGLQYSVTPNETILVAEEEGGPDPGNGWTTLSQRRMAQASERKSQTGSDEEEVFDPDYVSDENPRGIPEILVTGKKGTLNMDIARTEDDVQPYVVFDRELIERSGAANLEQFFKGRLTMNTSVLSRSQRPTSGNRSSINLRGLGDDETLILVDGRRLASVSTNLSVSQPDINGIPLASIERIEVLPTTASGIYGGGATGGVINIVLRRDYSGLDTKLTYGNTFNSDVTNRRIDINAGFALENGKTNVLIAGSFADSNTLLTRERKLAQQGRQLILANNPSIYFAGNPPLGATTNIQSAVLTNGVTEGLVLDDGRPLNSPITSVPYGYAGTATDSGSAFIEYAGAYNFALADTAQPDGGNRGLTNNPETKSLVVTIRRDFTPHVQTFLDFQAFDNASQFAYNSSPLTHFVPGDAPSNPFQQDVQVTVPAIGMDSTYLVNSRSRNAAAGLVLKLPKNWTAGIDFTWNRSRSSYTEPSGFSQTTLDGISDGLIDVFHDLNRFPVSFEREETAIRFSSPSDAILESSAIRLAGPLPWSLPAGEVILSTLIEDRKESIKDYVVNDDLLIPERSQSINSVYLETIVPVISARNSLRGIDELEVQLAVRWDNYRVTGTPNFVDLGNPGQIARFSNSESSIDPTFGLRYQPVQHMTFRASYATGYLPPSMTQIVPNNPQEFNVGAFISDPLRNNEPLGTIAFVNGGNPNLRPESSESISFGAILTPSNTPGLRLSADWIRIRKTDNIDRPRILSQPGLEQAISLFPERIIRGPQSGDGFELGPIIRLDDTAINIAQLNVEALDLSVDYQVTSARFGTGKLSVDATRVVSFETQATPGAAVIENAGALSGGLEWRAGATLSWENQGFGLSWRTSFFDSYFLNQNHAVNASQGSATVPSQIYHDLYGSYRFSGSAGSILNDAEIYFGINNVFNEQPPVDVTSFGVGYYSPLGDPRLANYYLSVKKSIDL